MQRIIAQARKELTQIVRDRLALALALVLPVGLTALLGTSISLTVTDIPLVVQDLDQTRCPAGTSMRSGPRSPSASSRCPRGGRRRPRSPRAELVPR